MKILFASSEVYPLIKTGGLADVAAHLPMALHKLGLNIRIILPGYPAVLQQTQNHKKIRTLQLGDDKVEVLETQLPQSEIKVWIVRCARLYERDGGPYQDIHGRDWPDNAQRFFVFCKTVAALALKAVNRWRPDIVHCNDWQTGMIPLLLRQEAGAPPTLFTVHNLAYQGVFPYSTFLELGLPAQYWHYQSVEFYGQLSFMKGGLVYADYINTVSSRYAEEIKTPQFGCGMDGLLQQRAAHLRGILNGMDTVEWNPQQDTHLAKPYDRLNLTGKHANKAALQKLFGLPADPQALLCGVVSRLTHQKGIDLIVEALPGLLRLPVQIVILGAGDKNIETALQDATRNYPGRIAIRIAYNEPWAHLVIAGSDAFLMPSRFEPCGLTQLYSLRYGTVPIVTAVGGLADTVIHASPENLQNQSATGIWLKAANHAGLTHAVQYAVDLYRKPAVWRQLQAAGMQQDYSWQKSAQEYATLYSSLKPDTIKSRRRK
jgi:starch synthase